jgi:tripartite-type tricarboxylate transporter receptor subunit TctC
MRRIGIMAFIAASLAALALPAPLRAQEAQGRPIRLVIPFAPGATTDLLARLLAQKLTEALGQNVVPENRAGAGATLGSLAVARAAPDGMTLLYSNAASHGTAPAMRPAPYDPVADFAHIGLMGTIAQYLVVNPALPTPTLVDFIAHVRANPGRVNLGTAGVGSIGHFAGALFMSMAGLNMVTVPYNGTAPATADLIAGNVQAVFQNAPEATQLVRDGRIRLLAVTGAQRVRDFPDAPTFTESVMPGFVNYTWGGLSAPRGTPDAIVQRLNLAMNRILAEPATAQYLRGLGVEPGAMSSAEYTAFVAAEVAKFRRIAEQAQIREN